MSFSNTLVKQKVEPKTFLDNLSTEEIYSEDIFNAIKYAAFYFIDHYDKDGAMVFARKLEKLVLSLSPQTDREKHIVKILKFWFLRLRVFSLALLPLKEQVDIFKRYIMKF
jgi:hypothetical protein